MKFTLSWLKDHLQTEATLEEIADKLTSIGLEVEEVVDPAKKLAGFRVARVLEAEPHPNSDKLKVCKVDAGGETLQVVCGAPNARKGLLGVFAPSGTYIPGTGITLGKASIRGVDSAGMLCSERELELSSEHAGIIELPERFKKHVGEAFAPLMGLDDPVIEVAITPNRPDCLGVRGIARDLAAAGLGKLSKLDDGYQGGDYESEIAIELHFPKDKQDACPVFAGRMVTGIKNKPSPEWMQRRLRAIGLRPINAAVDVTNYLTYDQARPLHVYDARKISRPIMARLGKAGESFLGLDGKTHEVDEAMCVIADRERVLGLGGIMGGEESSCTEDTTAIFLESAYFDPTRTAAAGRKSGINSDARYRFERGIDPASVLPGLNQATKMILEICGGKASTVVMAGKVPERHLTITFDPALAGRLTGVKFQNGEIVSSLKRLGFSVQGKAPKLTVEPPSWRPDIHGAWDLVEEAVRIAGGERIPSTPLPREEGVAKAVLTPQQMRVATSKRVLAGRGMVEAVTWSFISEETAHHFGGGAAVLRLANPISQEMTDMRPSLLPGLAQAARANVNRGFPDLALFEVGQVFTGGEPGEQMDCASGLRIGTSRLRGAGRFWQEAPQPVSLFDAKEDALSVLSSLGLDADKIQITRNAPAWYHPGKSGAIQLGPKTILAHFGELHPLTLKKLDLSGPVAAFEVFLNAIPQARKKGTAKPPLFASDFQPVKRDFAFLVDRDVEAAKLVKAVESATKGLMSRVVVFDVFEGERMPEGKKSVGIELTLTPKEGTLTDAEIDKIASEVVAAARKACHAELRM